MLTIFGWRKRCRALEAENAQLRTRVVQLETQVQTLHADVARLTQALAVAHKHSGNSSKPPSSDLVKPPAARRQRGKRKRGGQQGHPWNEPVTFPPERIDERQEYRLERCPIDPSHHLVPTDQIHHTLYQVELVDQPVRIVAHVAYNAWCEPCHRYHTAPLPAAVNRAGLFGPRLTSFMCYLKGQLHGSYSGLQDLCAAVLKVPVSRSYLVKVLHQGAQAFAAPYEALVGLLPQQPHQNVDETGHKENGQRWWIWCFRTVAFVVFLIRPSRGAEVLTDILGADYSGILGADFWGAYRKYARQCGARIQFCLAHLVREVKYLCEFPHAGVQRYGRRLLAGLQVLFNTLHRRGQWGPTTVERDLLAAKAQIFSAALDPQAHPERYGGEPIPRLVQTMVKRFDQHGEGYFHFITHPEIEPTNNACEQAHRFVVTDRHITQGTRSARGREICERLWTVMGTCALQHRSAYDWMCQAMEAYFQGQPVPSLLLNSS